MSSGMQISERGIVVVVGVVEDFKGKKIAGI
jgi:hypothetical protein